MDAILLAGGKGTRMNQPVPKVLVPVHGKTILAHQLDYLLPKVDKIILALGFQAEHVVEYVKQHYSDKPVFCSLEETPLGTGGALKKALCQSTADRVLVLNCDDLTDIDVSAFTNVAEHHIFVANPRLPFGLVDSSDGYANFVEKPVMKNHWVSCGWYMFLREDIYDLLPDKGMLEYDVFPKIKLKVHQHTGFWQPLNSPKDIQSFEEAPLPESYR